MGAVEAAFARGEGKRGRPAQDNRRFIDAVCWIPRTGAPWRDLPPDYGDWKNTHRRFTLAGPGRVGRTVPVIDDPDFEWLMIRQLYQGPCPQRRRPGRKSVHCPHKRGLNSKLHLAVDSHGMPVRLAVTEGTFGDCSQALPLIEGIEAECLLADKAYDTNEIIATVRELGMDPVIPPKSNRREKRDYDRALYKLRHLVENGFLEFKQWRGVATRYAKRTASYLTICQLRAVMIWSKLF